MIDLSGPAPLYIPKREIVRPPKPGLICPPRFRSPCKRATMVQPMRRPGGSGGGGGGISFVGGFVEGYAGSLSSTHSLSLTSLSGGLDTSPQENDFVLAVLSAADTNPTGYTWPGGWTKIGTDLYANGSYDNNLTCAYKIMGASPDTSVAVPATGDNDGAGAALAYVWRGVDQSTPLDVASTGTTGTGSLIANPPSITPATSGALIVALGGASHNLGTANDFTHALDNVFSDTGDDVLDAVVGACSFDGWTSGAYDPAAFGHAGADNAIFTWCARTIALRPA